MKKLWGGRFTTDANAFAETFGASIHFDKRLARFDIAGSIAHATMLGETGIIPDGESKAIVAGLKVLLDRLNTDGLEFRTEDEDIHLNIERLLTADIGTVAGKLHTARSRNDQVALDLHLFVRAQLVEVGGLLCDLIRSLLSIANAHRTAIMPGYTHLQRAQPILFAHHMHAYMQMFQRDTERLQDLWKRVNVSPLGSSALAGTTFPIDRELVAQHLGFDTVYTNSMDAVSDRDFAIEYVTVCSSIMLHLSRLCEELIIWSTSEFSFVEFDDAFSTGSSIMPQKKNPDFAELIRGKTGRVYGSLLSLLTTMKGLPLTYNKDMQEDKEPIFDVTDTVTGCLKVAGDMIGSLKIKTHEMRRAAERGFTNATDAADYLAKKGLPFREAHEVIGKLVKDCIARKVELSELTLDEYQSYSQLFEKDIFEAISLEVVVNKRASLGGTAASSVNAQLLRTTEAVDNNEAWLNTKKYALYSES